MGAVGDRDRPGARHVTARDVWSAGVVAVVSVGLVVLLVGPYGARAGILLTPRQRGAVVVLTAVQALGLCLRRARPGATLVLTAAVQAGLTLVVPVQVVVRGFVPLIAFYSAGRLLEPARLLTWAVVATGVELLGAPVLALLTGSWWRSWSGASSSAADVPLPAWALSSAATVLLYGAAGLAGLGVATRRQNVLLRRDRALAQERERAEAVRRALETERARMARELHDVAAHHLSGLMLQAAAARRLIARDRPAAEAAMDGVREQGRQALDNLRAVVGMMRQTDRTEDSPVLDAVTPGRTGPSAAEVLLRLVESARELGDVIEVRTSGTAYPVAPVSAAAAYRILQEALSNARRHAPDQQVLVTLDHESEQLRLTVENALHALHTVPTGSVGPGLGTLGMRERAELVGARVSAGPGPGPVWRVELLLPRPAWDHRAEAGR